MDGGGFIQNKLTDRIKIYLVVGLALVLAALVYRYLHAKASHKGSVSPPSATTPVSDIPELPALDTESLQKTQLAQAKDKGPRRVFLRDIFAPLRPLAKMTPQPTRKNRPSPQKVSSLKLKGVIVGGRNPVAIINGKLLRKGERIEGYEVIRIEEKEVFLKSGNRTVKLKLANNE